MNCPFCKTPNAPGALACGACGAPLQAGEGGVAAPALPVGAKLAGGRFSIGKVVRRGESDITYLGSDVSLRRLVTIQEFFPAGCTRPGAAVQPGGAWTPGAYAEARDHVLRAGQTLAQLAHFGLARVAAAFEENNTVYVVAEHPAGKTLAALLAERGGTLPEAEALSAIESAGAALEVLHGAGLVHGDIRPEHLVVGGAPRPGSVVVTGFRVDVGVKRPDAGPPGVAMLSRYAPPEQYARQAPLGPPGDVYALAATLYHLLGGKPPVAATARAAGVALVDLTQLNPRVGAGVARAVVEALALEAPRRPQSVREFLQRLLSQGTGDGRQSVVGSRQETDDLNTLAVMSSRASIQKSAPVTPQSALATPQSKILRPNALGLQKLIGHKGKVTALAFSPDGSLLASAGEEGAVLLWDAHAGTLVRTLPEALASTIAGQIAAARAGAPLPRLSPVPVLHETKRIAETVRRQLKSGEGRVASVAFAPDSRTLVSGHEDGAVILWDTRTGRLIKTLKGHEGRVTSVAWSPRGDHIASGSSDSTVLVWDAAAGKLLRHLAEHGSGVTSLAFSHDGDLLATGSYDASVLLWAMQSGEWLRTLHATGHEITSLAFSPSGRTLATGSFDKSVILWDLQAGVPLWTLEDHLGGVTSVAFSPDGKTLASGSYDKTVRLWDAWMGEPKATLADHWTRVAAVAFAPDGKRLASATHLEVWVWKIE